MKLGEAGEAFFVEELENDLSDGLGSSLPSSERLERNKKDHGISHEVNFEEKISLPYDSFQNSVVILVERKQY